MDISTFTFGFVCGVLVTFLIMAAVTLRFLMPFIQEAQQKVRQSS